MSFMYCLSSVKGPDPECDKKCANGGWCNYEKICQCPEGYMGQYCKTALCYPQCMNGGSCTAPGVCSCPIGFQGRHCEGGKKLRKNAAFIHIIQIKNVRSQLVMHRNIKATFPVPPQTLRTVYTS